MYVVFAKHLCPWVKKKQIFVVHRCLIGLRNEKQVSLKSLIIDMKYFVWQFDVAAEGL